MSQSAILTPVNVTLDDFVALNHEIAALARAGVPLGPGLSAFGADLPGKLGRIAAEVGQRLEQGEPLDRIIASYDGFPPAYKAVVEAGLRVGRLPAALEGISQSARRTSQLRWTVGMAMVYPLIVMTLGCVLMSFTLTRILPVMAAALADFGAAESPLHKVLAFFDRTSAWWLVALPTTILVWFTWLWYCSGRIARGVELHPLFSAGAVGSLLKLRRASRLAAMCDCLALLAEYGVPLQNAVALAGKTTGSAALQRGAAALADQIARGEQKESAPRGFPPLLGWMLTSGNLQGDLPAALRRAAGVYRDEASRRAQWLRLYAPVILTAVFGGGTVLLYALATFGPFVFILHKLVEAGLRP